LTFTVQWIQEILCIFNSECFLCLYGKSSVPFSAFENQYTRERFIHSNGQDTECRSFQTDLESVATYEGVSKSFRTESITK